MQLGLSFTALLASILAISSVPTDAAPLRRAPKSVSVPLTSNHGLRSNLPADVQLARHINRSHRRHARFTGRDEPTYEELEGHLRRRTGVDVTKRFQRPDGLTTAEVKAKTWTKLNNTPAAREFSSDAHKRHVENLAAQLLGGKAKANKGVNQLAAADASEGFSAASLAAQQANALTDSNTPATKNAAALNIEGNDVGYIATFEIGTPPTKFNLLTDSGSSDLWVGSADQCQNTDTGADCGKHTFLGTKTSSSLVVSKDQFQVTYGTGAVAGFKVTDDLNVAGLTLKAHAFGVAVQETDDFANDQTTFDGLMGLAQSTLSNQKVLTPPESLAQQGLVSEAIVSYRIPRLADNLKDGQITFGAADPATFDAATAVTLANVNKQGFWEADMDAVTFAGKDVGLTGRTAILDTGTTLIVAPQADVEAVLGQVAGAKTDGQGNFLIPCTTTDQLALTFGKQQFLIDSRDLIFAPADPNDLKGDCIPGISAGNIGGNTEWLVGDVFLKNTVFTTDVGKNNMQLAKPAKTA
jgi:hypothetical protein